MVKKEKEWFVELKDKPPKTSKITETIQRAFSLKAVVVEFIDILFSFLISYIIKDPLISLAHLIRTGEWDYQINIFSFAVFIALVFLIISVLYFASRPIRKIIEEEFVSERRNFYAKLISIIFAFLVIDVFIDTIAVLSDLITFTEITYDLSIIVDKIIGSILLLISVLMIYAIMTRRTQKEDANS